MRVALRQEERKNVKHAREQQCGEREREKRERERREREREREREGERESERELTLLSALLKLIRKEAPDVVVFVFAHHDLWRLLQSSRVY